MTERKNRGGSLTLNTHPLPLLTAAEMKTALRSPPDENTEVVLSIPVGFNMMTRHGQREWATQRKQLIEVSDIITITSDTLVSTAELIESSRRQSPFDDINRRIAEIEATAERMEVDFHEVDDIDTFDSNAFFKSHGLSERFVD